MMSVFSEYQQKTLATIPVFVLERVK